MKKGDNVRWKVLLIVLDTDVQRRCIVPPRGVALALIPPPLHNFLSPLSLTLSRFPSRRDAVRYRYRKTLKYEKSCRLYFTARLETGEGKG